MNNYTKVQRIAWSLLLVTGAVESNELELHGVSKKQAEAWAKYLLERQIRFEDVMQICADGDTDVSINHLLTLCLDQRAYTKSVSVKHNSSTNNENKREKT